MGFVFPFPHLVDSNLWSARKRIADKRLTPPCIEPDTVEKARNNPPSTSLPIRTRLTADTALFTAFTASARIPAFARSNLPEMEALSSYNDDVVIEHYESASRTYIGEQRIGIADDHPDASSLDELICEARSARFHWPSGFRFRSPP